MKTKLIFKKVQNYLPTIVKKNQNPVRWGIIGTGNMAETFGRAIDRNKNGIIQAVVSRTQENAVKYSNKHSKCKAYSNYEEFVKDETIDVIYIATPLKQHYQNIRLCLQNKKNVICEKPFTETEEQMVELQKLAKENNCFLMEGMWMKCLPTYQNAIKWIQEGKIGEIELIKVDFYKHEIVNTDYDIFNKERGGGVLNDYGIYALSFPLAFIKGIITISGNCRKSQNGIDTDWQITMKSKDTKVFINISSDFKGTSRAAIMGTKGSIQWEPQFNRTNKIKLYNSDGIQTDYFEAKYQCEGFEYEVNEVQNCVKKKILESTMVPLHTTENTLKIRDNLYKFSNEEFVIVL